MFCVKITDREVVELGAARCAQLERDLADLTGQGLVRAWRIQDPPGPLTISGDLNVVLGIVDYVRPEAGR